MIRAWSAYISAAVMGLILLKVINTTEAADFKNLEAATNPVRGDNPLLPGGQKIFAQYGGSESCQDCHAEEYRLWKSSNHGLAERLIQPPRDRSDFDPPQTFKHGTQTSEASWSNGVATVTTIGLSRQPEAHAIARVIGNDPLLQYLVSFPGGRFQTLEASYDPHSNQWFNAYGNDDRHSRASGDTGPGAA